MKINTSHYSLTWAVLTLYGAFIFWWFSTYFGNYGLSGASAVQVIQVYVEFIGASVFFGVIQLTIMTLALIEGNRTADRNAKLSKVS